MPSSTHVSNANVSVLLQALATPGAGFGTVTLLVDEAQGTGNPLNAGARYQDFASAAEAATAQAASEITAEVEDAIGVAFSQALQPTKVRVCRVDTAGGETYSDALTALESEGLTDLWMLCMDSRVPATQIALSTTIESKAGAYFLFLQADDADWKTAGTAAAWTGASEAYEHSGIAWHSTDAEWGEVALAVRNLAFDPDQTSVGWEKDVANVGAYAAYVTATQRTNMITNDIAVMGTWGSSDFWFDNVVNRNGRPVKEMLTAAWYRARLKERIQTMHQREAAAGRAVLVAQSGMTQLLSVIEGLNADAVAASHFVPGQVVTTPQPITAADISAQRLRAVVEAQVGTAARVFDVDGYFSQTAVVEVA